MRDRTSSKACEFVFPVESEALDHVSPEFPCPYLSDRLARFEAYRVEKLSPSAYTKLLSLGFRRSGFVVYRPRCRGCRECRQLRVDVRQFKMTRSMHRVQRLNVDLCVEVARPQASIQLFAMYERYLDARHDDSMDRSFESFRSYLHESPAESIEVRYVLQDQVIGVSILDPCEDGLSSVYMYFEPSAAYRSPGVFSVLSEIEQCRKLGLPYYYLGYWVEGSDKMNYKARFRPNEVLAQYDQWVPLRV
jgi:arginine-tRNA-protein transferase